MNVSIQKETLVTNKILLWLLKKVFGYFMRVFLRENWQGRPVVTCWDYPL